MHWSPGKRMPFQERQVNSRCHCIFPLFQFQYQLRSGKCGSAGLSALHPVELTWAPVSISFTSSSNFTPSPTIAPHPIIPVTLKFPNQAPICAHALIDSGAQSSFISDTFACQHLLPRQPLADPIPVQSIDGKPLSNGAVSSSVLANLCIQDHCEYKLFSIIDMNCNLILGIDWESHQISFPWCNGNNPVQPSKSVSTLKKGDAMGISSSLDNSIHVAVLSVDDFFMQDQISTFGIINFIPDSIVLAASITNPTSEKPIPVPG